MPSPVCKVLLDLIMNVESNVEARYWKSPLLYLLARSTLEKVDKDQKDGIVALELEKIAGSSGASESEMAVDLSERKTKKRTKSDQNGQKREAWQSQEKSKAVTEFTDELALITYPPDYDDNHTCDIESDLRKIEFLLYQGEDSDLKDSIDQTNLANLDDLFVDLTPEMFIDEQPPDYSFSPRFDMYPDDFLEIESDTDKFFDDTFDSKGEKIKESELLIDQLDLPCDILPYSE
nr:FKBP-type peptidyl-prolyl cis-trans isomerase family protein [Tanacetum cinerariifolium]